MPSNALNPLKFPSKSHELGLKCLFLKNFPGSVEDKCKSTINHAVALADRHQEHSTKLLKERTHDVYRLKSTLERAIKAQMDEISTLEVQRNRLMEALTILKMPESICKHSIIVQFNFFQCLEEKTAQIFRSEGIRSYLKSLLPLFHSKRMHNCPQQAM